MDLLRLLPWETKALPTTLDIGDATEETSKVSGAMLARRNTISYHVHTIVMAAGP